MPGLDSRAIVHLHLQAQLQMTIPPSFKIMKASKIMKSFEDRGGPAL
jgi:hypothetical protein